MNHYNNLSEITHQREWGWDSSPAQPTMGTPKAVPTFTAVLSRMLRIETIMTLLSTVPGDITYLTIDQVGIYAVQALGIIKNRYTARYAVEAMLDQNGQADLPDNCNKIDVVLAGGFAGRSTVEVGTPLLPEVAASALPRQNRLYLNFPDSPLPQWGRPLDCTMVQGAGPTRLQLTAGTTGSVLIIYRSRLVDEVGSPLITADEANAILWYMLWIETGKKYWRQQATKDQMNTAKETWEQMLNIARNEGLNDLNGFRRMLDQQQSSHRHQYGSDVRIS